MPICIAAVDQTWYLLPVILALYNMICIAVQLCPTANTKKLATIQTNTLQNDIHIMPISCVSVSTPLR
jgi:hypothetical protein